MANQIENPVYLPLLSPFMNAGTHPERLQTGELSRSVGTDGRYRGCVKPFPGFKTYADLGAIARTANGTATPIGSVVNISFFKRAVIQRGTTGSQIAGFIVRFGADLDDQTVALVFEDDWTASTPEWKWLDVTAAASGFNWTDVPNTAHMDLSEYGPLLYLTCEGYQPLAIWWDNAAASKFQVAIMGVPADLRTMDAPITPTETNTTDGFLQYGGMYSFAYRFRATMRALYTPMSDDLLYTVASTSNTTLVTLTSPGSAGTTPADLALAEGFDTIEFFRTIDASSVSGYTGGIYYKESEMPLTTFITGHYQWNAGYMLDNQVVVMTVYDPDADVCIPPPRGGAIALYEGATFMGIDPADPSGGAGMAWTPIFITKPECFSSGGYYRTSWEDGRVLRFLLAGDIMYGFTDSLVYRIQLGGGLLTIGKFQFGRSILGADLAHSVGRDLLMLTPAGLCIMDGATGDLQIISAVDRVLLLEGWLSDVKLVGSSDSPQNSYLWSGQGHSAYDPTLSCSFFGNAKDRTAIVVWHSSWGVTMLQDWPYVAATNGYQEAFFIMEGGRVATPLPPGYTNGLMVPMTLSETCPYGSFAAFTVNGTAIAGTTPTTLKTMGNFSREFVGGELYVRANAADTAWTHTTITGWTDSNTISVATNPALVEGCLFSVAPVVVNCKLAGMSAQPNMRPGFQRCRLNTMSTHTDNISFSGLSDEAAATLITNPNAYWTYEVYRDHAPAPSVPVAAKMSDVPAQSYVNLGADRLGIDGVHLEPSVLSVCAGVDFQLTNIEVRGIITTSAQLSS